MLSAAQIESLERIPATVLTVYLNTQPEDPSRHLFVPKSLPGLRNEMKSMADGLEATESRQIKAQWDRIEKLVAGRHPAEKALAIFAGPGTWQLVPLPIPVESEVRWGRPAVSQLLLIADQWKPYCVVVMDKTEARFLRYQFGELERIEERRFILDISQWKTKEMGHVTGQGVRKTRGSQRDVFEHRADAQYARLCRETAQQALSLCRNEKLSGIFLVGPSHLVEPVAENIPAGFKESTGLFCEDLGRFPIDELSRRLAVPIRDWEQQRTESLVQSLLSAKRGVVTEPDEVLAQLQEGAIGKLVVTSDFPLSLRECDECGWADRAADPICPKCGAGRHATTLKDVLPLLARKYKTEVHVVDGSAAARLRELGGIGGWHREAKRAAAR
ncbi:MAG: VLRF1 family aeRF1-type release factor [Candidatus Acidiferrum sp.]